MNIYKKIPQVSKIIMDDKVRHFMSFFYIEEIKAEISVYLDLLRKDIKNNLITDIDYDDVIHGIIKRLEKKNKYSLKRVINATGTVLHTNLGRAILSNNAIENIVNVSKGYNNLEYNVELGSRGSRYDHVNDMIADLVGAEAALVVNNNAAATMLSVAAFAKDKEVIVSRGELIEIGGSFRIPEIIEASGAILKEVGTTNRTHLKDYINATNENTAMYLKVHPSNYKIEGFTKEVTNSEIASIDNEVISLEDLGSGALIDFSKYDFIKENTVSESIKSGIDLVTFSGDKLLGGPQAGIIVGKKNLIEDIKRHPLTRAFRVGKLTLSALEATIRDYQNKEVINSNPTLKMLFTSKEKLYNKAIYLHDLLNEIDNFHAIIEECNSTVGGGSLPTSEIPSYAVKLISDKHSANELEEFLRFLKTPVITTINNDSVYFDVRTLLDGDIEEIIKLIKEAL